MKSYTVMIQIRYVSSMFLDEMKPLTYQVRTMKRELSTYVLWYHASDKLEQEYLCGTQ